MRRSAQPAIIKAICLIHAIRCLLFSRYNGLLGDYAVNNHNISVQFMRKFQIGHQLARINWPAIMSADLKDVVTPNSITRGTLSSVGNDIMTHAKLALLDSVPECHFALPTADHSTSCVGDYINLNGPDARYLSDLEYRRISDFYQTIFPSDQVPVLLRRVDIVKSLLYYGEHFQADNADKINCNIVRARWLKAAYPLTIDPSERFARAGTIKRIIVTRHSNGNVIESLILLDMEWFSMHDEPYSYGQHVQMYHKSACEPGVYSFLPIQRVLSKCALKVCRHNNINVNVVIPLSGIWAL